MPNKKNVGLLPTPKNTRKQAKRLLKTLAQHGAQFLSAGGASTNFVVAVAPDFIRKRVCENAGQIQGSAFLNRLNAVTVVDMGDYLFLTSGTIRAILFPSLYFAGKQLYLIFAEKFNLRQNPISKETLAFLEELEKSLISHVNTYSFIQNTPLFDSPGLTNAVSIVSVIPLAEFAGKAIQKRYYNLDEPSQSEEEQKAKERCHFILDAVQKSGLVTSSAASTRSVGSFIFNFFVDSTRTQDWEGQNLTLDLILCAAALIALGFIVKGGTRAETFLKQAAFCTGMFTTITTTIFSFYLCANPSNENIDTFWKKNWLSFIISCSAAIVASSLMRYSAKDTFKPAAGLNNVIEDITNETNPEASQKPETESGLLSQYGTFSEKSKDRTSNPISNPMLSDSDESHESDSESMSAFNSYKD